MKLKFLAGSGFTAYDIAGDVINGIDVSPFIEGSTFQGNEETKAAGIFDMFWQAGELHIVLAQATSTTGLSWAPREGEWIDAIAYDPSARYVVATNPQALALLQGGEAEYFQDTDGKWSVRMIESVEEEPVA